MNVWIDSTQEIAEQIKARLTRGHGIMVVVIRKDGRVRINREDLLSDDINNKLLGHFSRHHTVDDILPRIQLFIENNEPPKK